MQHIDIKAMSQTSQASQGTRVRMRTRRRTHAPVRMCAHTYTPVTSVTSVTNKEKQEVKCIAGRDVCRAIADSTCAIGFLMRFSGHASGIQVDGTEYDLVESKFQFTQRNRFAIAMTWGAGGCFGLIFLSRFVFRKGIERAAWLSHCLIGQHGLATSQQH